jgi:predicted nucleic acid-binding Zn ribbon protein
MSIMNLNSGFVKSQFVQPTSVCLVCGKPIPKSSKGVRYYCSHACNQTGWRLGLRPKAGAHREPVSRVYVNRRSHCLVCGKPIPKPSNGVRFYCSHYCRIKGYKAGLRPKIGHQTEHICDTCGAVFYSCMRDARYCSQECWEVGAEHWLYEHSEKRVNAKRATALRSYYNKRAKHAKPTNDKAVRYG